MISEVGNYKERDMKKLITIIAITPMLLILEAPLKKVNAEPIVIAEIIKKAVTKVIKAVDLKIQRLQNETIWLQNAQKVLENKLSELKLKEISDWAEKQRKLYDDYFQELWKVKEVISSFHRVKEIMKVQMKITEEYKRAFNLFKQDPNFTASEIDYMEKLYAGIFDESIKNLDQVLLVINSLKTQMTDAQRLAIITEASNAMEKNYHNLQRFNNQNIRLSLQRSKDENEVKRAKELYGIGD